MSAGDAFFGYLNNRRFTSGAEAFGAAERLEKDGHYGPAFALYGRAWELFMGSADNLTITRASSGEKRCRAEAVARGEEPSIALGWTWDQINANPQRWVADYYRRQVDHIGSTLERLTDEKRWKDILQGAPHVKGMGRYLDEDQRRHLEYLLSCFSGLAHLNLGNASEAAPLLSRAYEICRISEMKYLPLTVYNVAYYYGRSLFLSKQDATRVLQDCFQGLYTMVQTGHEKWKVCNEEHREDRGVVSELEDLCPRAMSAAVMLAESYKQAGSHDRILTLIHSADQIPSWAYPPHLGEQLLSYRNLVAAITKAKELINAGKGAFGKGDYAGARSTLTEAATGVEGLDVRELKDEIDGLLLKVNLHDPSMMPEHETRLNALLESAAFGEVDEFFGELSTAQPNHPGLANLRKQVLDAKQKFVEQATVQTREMLERSATAKARRLLEQGLAVASQIGMDAPELKALQVQTTGVEVKEKISRSEKSMAAGKLDEASTILKSVESIPGLDSELRDLLGQAMQTLSMQLAAAWKEVEKEVKAALAGEDYKKVETLVSQARKRLGSGRSEFLARAQDCVTGSRLIQEARKSISASRLDLANDYVRRVPTLPEAPGLQRQVQEVKAEIKSKERDQERARGKKLLGEMREFLNAGQLDEAKQKLDWLNKLECYGEFAPQIKELADRLNKVNEGAANYYVKELPGLAIGIGLITAIAVFVVFWHFGQGILSSLLGGGFLGWGVMSFMVCQQRRSTKVHDGNIHFLTVGVASAAYGAVAVLHRLAGGEGIWYRGLIVAVIAGVLFELFLQHEAPLAKPLGTDDAEKK